MPPEEIAFIHEANTGNKESGLFGKVRSGRVRFFIGFYAENGRRDKCAGQTDSLTPP